MIIGSYYLTGDCMNDAWQIMVFNLPVLLPWSKISKLSIVTVVSHPHLWPNMQDLPIVDDHSTVVYYVLVHNRPRT
jgi:hypothetical protein